MKDYIVIHQCTAPHNEYIQWKIVPKCIGPVDAVEKAEFNVPSSAFIDHVLVVIEVAKDFKPVTFTPKEGSVVWRKETK